MIDTSPEIERKFREMLLQRSGEERLKMGCSMYATARALVIASVLEKDPDASPAALRRALFLRFYGPDFDPATRGKILLALETVSSAPPPTRSGGPLKMPSFDERFQAATGCWPFPYQRWLAETGEVATEIPLGPLKGYR